MLLTAKSCLERIKKRGIDLILPPKIWQTRVDVFSGEPFIYTTGEEILKIGKPVVSFNRNSIQATADPFLFVYRNRLYVFVEEKKYGLNGVISSYSSSNLEIWEYHGVVLSEDFHLSYPQVFGCENFIGMIPEATGSGSTWLYSTEDFPFRWQKVHCLVNVPLLDATLVQRDGCYFLFGTDLNGVLRLYFSEEIKGDFLEHPSSPITKDSKYSRCGGSFINQDGILYRLAQDGSRSYGRGLHAMKVEELNRNHYVERLVHEDFFPRTDSWSQFGVHHLSIIDFEGKKIRAIDGLGYDLSLNQFRRYFWAITRRMGLNS